MGARVGEKFWIGSYGGSRFGIFVLGGDVETA